MGRMSDLAIRAAEAPWALTDAERAVVDAAAPDDDRPEDCGCARYREEAQRIEEEGARVLGLQLTLDELARDRAGVVEERAGLPGPRYRELPIDTFEPF